MGYPQIVYREAFDRLEERRRSSRAEADRRRREIHARIPDIADIERRMAAAAAASVYAVASGADNAGEQVAERGRESLNLQERRRQLLREAGYPENYLEEPHSCALCGDTGYRETEMCGCLESLLRQIAVERLSDQASLGQCGFADFDVDYYSSRPDRGGVIPRHHMGEVLAYCKHYAEQFSQHSESLLFLGRTGQGKTHLSLAVARAVTERGFGVVYTPYQKLIDRLEAGRFSYGEEQKDRYRQDLQGVMECDLLILDDLGAEFATPFSTATAYNIVNTRLVEQRPTIISTNLELAAMEKQYSQRLASRLGFSYKVLAFYGEDIRFLKRAGRKGDDR